MNLASLSLQIFFTVHAIEGKRSTVNLDNNDQFFDKLTSDIDRRMPNLNLWSNEDRFMKSPFNADNSFDQLERDINQGMNSNMFGKMSKNNKKLLRKSMSIESTFELPNYQELNVRPRDNLRPKPKNKMSSDMFANSYEARAFAFATPPPDSVVRRSDDQDEFSNRDYEDYNEPKRTKKTPIALKFDR